MGNNELTLAVISSVTAVVLAIIGVIKHADVISLFFKNRRQDALNKVYRDDLIELAKALELLEGTTRDRARTGVDRAILLRGHNSGGAPNPATPYYGEIISVALSAGYTAGVDVTREQIRKRYSNIQVDSHYVQLLAEAIVADQQDLIIDTEKLGPCLLRDIYEVEGLRHSIISFITTRNKGRDIIYMTQSKHDDEPFSANQIVEARLTANRMRQLMKQ